MNLKNLVYITGVAALVFSLADFFAAQIAAATLGGEALNRIGVAGIQLRGAVGLLYVFLAYFSRNADENALRRVVGPTMMWGFIAQSVAIIYILLTGGFNALGWIFILLGAIFISAYAYLLYVQPARR